MTLFISSRKYLHILPCLLDWTNNLAALLLFLSSSNPTSFCVSAFVQIVPVASLPIYSDVFLGPYFPTLLSLARLFAIDFPSCFGLSRQTATRLRSPGIHIRAAFPRRYRP